MPLTVYKASAGSGKTFMLTQTYHKLVKNTHHKHILAVTFTNKATQEMKERIVETLYNIAHNQHKENENSARFTQQQAQEKLQQLLHDFSLFNVSTIDGFYQQIMRTFVRELGLSNSYVLVLDQKEVVAHAIDDLILSLQENTPLYNWLLQRAKENIKSNTDWQFKKSLNNLAKQLFREDVAAWIEALRTWPNLYENIKTLKLQLTQQKETLQKTLYQHSQQVLTRWEEAGFTIEQAKKHTLTQCKKCKPNEWASFTKTFLDVYQQPANLFTQPMLKHHPAYPTIVQEKGIDTAINELLQFYQDNTCAYYSATAILQKLDLLPVLLELNQFIENYLKSNNMVLLSKVNQFLYDMIKECDTPFIYEKLGYYLHHYMLDEFQDTSLLQWKNFKPLIDNSLSNGDFNLVVGDIKQSIYRWRNSDWRILNNIKDNFAAQSVIEDNTSLDTNWRSNKQIVQFNNAFFTYLPRVFKDEAENHQLIPQLYADLVQKVSPKHQDTDGLVQISKFKEKQQLKTDNTTVLQKKVIEIIQQAIERGYQYKDIAILVRTNNNGITSAQWLLNANIPVISSDALQLSLSPAIRLLITIIRMSCSFQLETEAFKISLLRNCKEEEKQDIINNITQYMHLPLYEAVENYIRLFQLNDNIENTAYLQAFQDLVYDYTTNNSPDAASFIHWWDQVGCDKKLPANDQLDAVQISTIHKAKGLAYPIVILPFCTDKIWDGNKNETIIWCSTQQTPYQDWLPVLPLAWNKNLVNTSFKHLYDDEKLYKSIDYINQLYVACTRPMNALYLFLDKEEVSKTISNSTDAILSTLHAMPEKGTETEDNDFTYITFGSLPNKPPQEIEEKTKEEEEEKEEEKPTKVYQTDVPYFSHQHYHIDPTVTNQAQEKGTAMHQILQYIITATDVDNAIHKGLRMGIILPDNEKETRTLIQNLLNHPQAKTWFDGTYPKVWNERSIITSHTEVNETGKYRPDRLLVKDDHIVVVDYKFGKERKKHLQDMRFYMQQLQAMQKWNKIEGFLYYSLTNRIQPVSI